MQFGCNDEWTLESTERSGLPVKTASIEGVLFVCICVDSFISWKKPFEEDIASSFDPSVALISLDHQDWDLALKSPVIVDDAGLWLLMSFTSFSRLDKSESNSLLLRLGER